MGLYRDARLFQNSKIVPTTNFLFRFHALVKTVINSNKRGGVRIKELDYQISLVLVALSLPWTCNRHQKSAAQLYEAKLGNPKYPAKSW